MRALRQRFARPLLILGFLLFIASGIPAFGHTLVAYEGTLYSVSADPNIKDVTYQGQSILTADRQQIDVAKLAWTQDHTWQSFPIQISRNGQAQPADFLVLGRWFIAGSAGLGLVLIVLTLPSLFISTNVRSRGTTTPIQGWNYLLTTHDGLSLSRLQLFIWFLPGIVTYSILAWPTHTFPSVPSSLWMLLGLGGATAAISNTVSGQPDASGSGGGGGGGGGGEPAPDPVAVATAAQQVRQVFQQAAAGLQHLASDGAATDAASIAAQAQAAEAALQQVAAAADSLQQAASTPAQYVYAAPPRIADMVEDQDGYGDVSRYQYLILCVIGAAVFLVTFLQTWQVPTLPDQFVPLVATSQATYLVVKSIKFVRNQPSSKN